MQRKQILNTQLSKLQEELLCALRGSEQQKFLAHIEPIAELSTEDCLEIYSRGYYARLIEAMGETFEATWWVLGDDDYFELAKEYVQLNTSQVYDLSQYGEGFASFLALKQQSNEIPFLVDLARFEWIFKEVFHCPDINQPEDLFQESISELTHLIRSPSAFLLKSEYSIYEVWKQRSQPIEALDDVDFFSAENLLIYKTSGRVFVRKMAAEVWGMLNSLFAGKNLGEAIAELSNKYTDLSPSQMQSFFTEIARLGVFQSKEITQ